MTPEAVCLARTNSQSTGSLYVATNLTFFKNETPISTATEVEVDGILYRPLDPKYYAWLRHKMTLAKKGADSGQVPEAVFERIRDLFNEIHAWAIEHFDEKALLAAVNILRPKSYSPPLSEDQERGTHFFPKDGDLPFTQKVSRASVAKVDAIKETALSLGWSVARLYRNRSRLCFPVGQEYGLVCFLDRFATIGVVTRQFIEIVKPSYRTHNLRFYNPDVEQPWIKRVGEPRPAGGRHG